MMSSGPGLDQARPVWTIRWTRGFGPDPAGTSLAIGSDEELTRTPSPAGPPVDTMFSW